MFPYCLSRTKVLSYLCESDSAWPCLSLQLPFCTPVTFCSQFTRGATCKRKLQDIVIRVMMRGVEGRNFTWQLICYCILIPKARSIRRFASNFSFLQIHTYPGRQFVGLTWKGLCHLHKDLNGFRNPSLELV